MMGGAELNGGDLGGHRQNPLKPLTWTRVDFQQAARPLVFLTCPKIIELV